MLENTVTLNEGDEIYAENDIEELSGGQKRENAGALSNLQKEKHCTLYIWDNYLVQSFFYGVFNQLQGTGIVLNNGSECCSYSELRRPKGTNNKRHSLECQIHNKMKQRTICDMCGRPTLFCTCRCLDPHVESLRHSMNNQERACCLSSEVLSECGYRSILEFPESIMKNMNSADVYLLQNENQTTVPLKNYVQQMKKAGTNTCKIPIRCTYSPAEKAVRYSKIQQTPVFRPFDAKSTYFHQGNKLTDTGKLGHCENCDKPLSRCVCVNMKEHHRKGNKEYHDKRISSRGTCSKFNNKKAPHELFHEGRQLTGIIERIERSALHTSRKNSESHKMIETIIINREPSQNFCNEYESNIRGNDRGKESLCLDQGTDMKNDFTRIVVTDCAEKRQIDPFNEDIELCMNMLEASVPDIPRKPSLFRCGVTEGAENEILNSTEQLTKEGIIIKKALEDLNIIVTIKKQTDDIIPSNYLDEQYVIKSGHGDDTTLFIPSASEDGKILEKPFGNMETEPCLEDNNSQLSPHLTFEKERGTELQVNYSCRNIQSDREQQNSDRGESDHQHLSNERSMQEFLEIEEKSQCRFNSAMVENPLNSEEDLRILSNNEPEKNRETKIETSPSYRDEISERNEKLKSGYCTSDVALRSVNGNFITKIPQEEVNNKVILHKRFRYSSKNGWITEINNASTDSIKDSEETEGDDFQVSCSVEGKAIKRSTPSLETNENFFNTATTADENTNSENIGVVAVHQNYSSQFLSTTSERTLGNKQPLKTNTSTSKVESEDDEISNLNTGVEYETKLLKNQWQCIKRSTEFMERTQQCNQCQTGGTLEQDLIASFVSSCNSNEKGMMSRQCIIQTLFHQFGSYGFSKRFIPEFLGKSLKISGNSNIAQLLNLQKSIRSTKTQVGSGNALKCEETQTKTTFVSSDLNSDTGAVRSPLFRKKFNYVCGPDSPGFKTKISMNLNDLLPVDERGRIFAMEEHRRDEETKQMVHKTFSDATYTESTKCGKERINRSTENKNISVTGKSIRTYPCEPSYHVIIKTPDGKINKTRDYKNTEKKNDLQKKKYQRQTYDSINSQKFKEPSSKSREVGSYINGGAQEQQPNMEKVEVRPKSKRRYFEALSCERKKADIKNVPLDSYYTTKATFGTQTSGSFKQRIPNSSTDNLVATGSLSSDMAVVEQKIQRKYVLKRCVPEDGNNVCGRPNRHENILNTKNRNVATGYAEIAYSISNIPKKELYANNIYVVASDEAKSEDEMISRKNVETSLDQTDFLSLESAMNQFIEITKKIEQYE